MFASTTESPVLLVGTAHVVDLREPLRRVLAGRTLDAVALELDPERAQAILAPAPPTGPRATGAPFFVRLWGLMQQRLGAEIGGGFAGAEMRVAAEYAREHGLTIFLIDDPVRETLTKLLRSLSVRERVALLLGGVVGLIAPPRVVEAQLDRYAEAPDDLLGQMRESYPTVTRVLLDERNEHMADRLAGIRQQGVGRVAAVVGDAHLPGLAGALRRRGLPVDTVPFRELVGPTERPASPSSPAPPPA